MPRSLATGSWEWRQKIDRVGALFSNCIKIETLQKLHACAIIVLALMTGTACALHFFLEKVPYSCMPNAFNVQFSLDLARY